MCHSSRLYADGRGAKTSAYLPNDGATSVYRIAGLEQNDVRLLGAKYLRNPTPIAHAISIAGSILDVGLNFDVNNTPERHVDIVGWPSRKEEQKLIALKLASAARVVRYPDPM